MDADALADAVYKLEEGESLSEDEGRLIQQAVESLMPKAEGSEPADNSVGQAMLALKKKKLELLLNGI